MPKPTAFAELCAAHDRLAAQCHSADCRIVCLERRVALLAQGGYSDRLQLAPARRTLAQAHRRCRKLVAARLLAAGALRARIAALPDPLLRTILDCRYVERLPWQQIAPLVGYQHRQLMRLHRRAVALVDAAADSHPSCSMARISAASTAALSSS